MDDGLVYVVYADDVPGNVLILIVVDYGLVRFFLFCIILGIAVLILVVVEDGLLLMKSFETVSAELSLNPCCSGRWSRTVIMSGATINIVQA